MSKVDSNQNHVEHKMTNHADSTSSSACLPN